MTLGFATSRPGFDRVPPALLRARAEAAGVLGTTQYWTPEIQAASFALPPYIARHLPQGG
jgi:spermidine synthase